MNFFKSSQLHRDYIEVLGLWRVIWLIAITDLIARYRRTLLGPLWIVIGLALGSLGLGFLWSELWNMPKEDIIPSITVGFLVWIFISNSVIEGAGCLLQDTNTIQNMRLPISFFSLVCLAKQLINFLHSILIIVAVSLVYPPENIWMTFWVIPGLLIIILFLFIKMTILGILCTRFRDIQPLLAAVMPMLFFLSPVLFRIQQAENISWLIWLNPFTYFIVLIREPLQGNAPEPFVAVVALCLTLFCYVILFWLMEKKRTQIVYWL